MIINGENLIYGRVASFAAKQALLGEEITIVNCSKMIITGNKKQIMDRFVQKMQMGSTTRGPFIHRSPMKIMLRAIRTMLPYKQDKGIKALQRIKCFNDVPSDIKIEDAKTIEMANISKLPNLKYMTIGTVSKLIGGIK